MGCSAPEFLTPSKTIWEGDLGHRDWIKKCLSSPLTRLPRYCIVGFVGVTAKPNISWLGPFNNRWTVRLWTDRTCTRRSHAESWRRVRCPKAHLLKGDCHEKTIFSKGLKIISRNLLYVCALMVFTMSLFQYYLYVR